MTQVLYTRECPNCGRIVRSPSMMAKYCGLRCKNSAGLKRRRIREAEQMQITEGRPAGAHTHKEISDAADRINAEKAAAIPAEDILPPEIVSPPSEFQSALGQSGFKLRPIEEIEAEEKAKRKED